MDEQVPTSPWDDSGNEQLIPSANAAPAGPYEYYQPPPPRTSQDKRRSYSERVAATDQPGINTKNGARQADSRKVRNEQLAAATAMSQKIAEPMQDLLDRHPETTSEQFAQTKHVNSTSLPGSSHQAPIPLDLDYVPENLRSKAWSPAPTSPTTQQEVLTQPKLRQTSNASNSSQPIRHKSVSGRSPLQKLEVKTKEEKRALLQEAESRVRRKSLSTNEGEGELLRHGTLRSEKGRAVSDGLPRRTSETRKRDGRSRDAYATASSNPTSPADGMNGVERFQNAKNALKKETSPPDEERFTTHSSLPPNFEQSKSQQHVSRRSRDEKRATDRTHHGTEYPRKSDDLGRTESSKYRLGAQDTGFRGPPAITNASTSVDPGAERGKAAYERRKVQTAPESPIIPVSPVSSRAPRPGTSGDQVSMGRSPKSDQTTPGIGRSGSRKLQKRQPGATAPARAQQNLQSDRAGGSSGRTDQRSPNTSQQPDPVPRSSVENPPNAPVRFAIPPQTAAAQQAKEQVGFSSESAAHQPASAERQHHRFGDLFHRHTRERRSYQESSAPLDDWRRGTFARLTLDDLEFEQASAAAAKSEQAAAWWEKDRRASSSGSRPTQSLTQYDGPYEEQANGFRPRLFLKCGPLLRYTGIRREPHPSSRSGRAEREIWRGSIMIVTEDDQSDLSSIPTLRLFAQPMDLHKPTQKPDKEAGQALRPDDEDPVAGQVKLSRTGRALYVRPVHEIEGGVDLSRQENPEGLYGVTRTPLLGPQSSTGPDGRQTQHITFQDKSRIKNRDGEKAGRHKDVQATRLHTERNCTFWRFNIEIELGSKQHRVAYRINRGPAMGFWVPATGETMNIMFHSCNGFSVSVNPNDFSGPDPLWRDVLNRHQSQPFHVMIGGGDQIYNDAAMLHAELFKQWLQTKNPESKHNADFTPEMQDELEQFYLDRYAMWFSQGLFGMANGQIPMVNIWDDHDIIDGYGSYPHRFQSTRVFAGVGAVAFKYYMLFQHQSLVAETETEEPSWLLGQSPGPYINEVSRSIFVSLGRKCAFLGLDCRTERMRDEIMSQETYDIIFDRLQKEIVKGETKHLIVLLGVPIAYPRLNFLENILTSRAMDPIKALGRTGMLGGFVNKFDGGVEILDDLDDHWTAKHHKGERNWFIRELQDLAASQSVRVTVLGGDVHLGAIGQFYSKKSLNVPKDRDHRYMPNVISSAIVNTPPPNMMADVLNRRNKVHHLDDETDEDMIPMFDHDVDGSKRNNTHLLPRRNFCTIREFVPGSTPPNTPLPGPQTPASATFGRFGDGTSERDRRFPPGSMRRTMSLTRGPMNLVRRLSGSSKSRHPPVSLAPGQTLPSDQQSLPNPSVQRANSLDSHAHTLPDGANQFPPERPGFHRRPTNLSIKEARKAAAKGGADGTLDDGLEPGHVNLENGLDVSLCMEIDQLDPTGATEPYRLLIPALWYEAPARPAGEAGAIELGRKKRLSLMDRLRGYRKREELAVDGADEGEEYSGEEEEEEDNEEEAFQNDPRAAPTKPSPPNALGLSNTEHTLQTAIGPHTDSYGVASNAPEHSSIGAYNKGFNLTGPPIGPGSFHASPPTQPAIPGNRVGTTQGRSQPNQRLTKASKQTSRMAGPEESVETLSSEEEMVDHQKQQRLPAPARRGSKAERFFGIGDGGTIAGAGGSTSGVGGAGGGGLWGPGGKLALGRTGQQLGENGLPIDSTGSGMGRQGSLAKRANWKIWK